MINNVLFQRTRNLSSGQNNLSVTNITISLSSLSISSFFPQPVATLFMKYLQIKDFFVKIQLCVGEKLLLSPGG